MEALFTSATVVALAEIGDKTQLLAIILAARFKKPLAIIAGIFAATIANHFLAAVVGAQVASILDGQWFRYLIAASFIAMAAWTLIPDKLDDDPEPKPARFGAFAATTIAFFLVEMGDKTQIATIALGARFHDVLAVTMGTTLGILSSSLSLLLSESIDQIPVTQMIGHSQLRATIRPSNLSTEEFAVEEVALPDRLVCDDQTRGDQLVQRIIRPVRLAGWRAVPEGQRQVDAVEQRLAGSADQLTTHFIVSAQPSCRRVGAPIVLDGSWLANNTRGRAGRGLTIDAARFSLLQAIVRDHPALKLFLG